MPHGRIVFEPEQESGVAFKIVDANTNTVLAATTKPISKHDLATRSDDWVRRFISELGGGDI
jgi:hypothetical protein